MPMPARARPLHLYVLWFGAVAGFAGACAWIGSGLAVAGLIQGGLVALAGLGAYAIARTRSDAESAARKAEETRLLGEAREREERLTAELTRAREAAAAALARALEAAEAADTRFRTAFEQVSAGMTQVTLDGRFMRVNQRYCAITGYTAEELSQLTVAELTHPDDHEHERRMSAPLYSGECSTVEYQKRYIRKDGSVIRVHLTVSLVRSAAGDPLYLIGAVEDITARIEAEEALRQSEERFRQVVEHAPFGIFVESGLEFRYLNPAAARLFGAESPRQLIGAPLLDRVHPEDRAAVRDGSRELLSGKTAPPAQRRFLRLDGEPVPVEVYPATVVYDGQPAVLFLMRDRTQELQSEQERIRLEQRLRHAEKMEGIGRLAGGVAHDFNNHLTVISGYCEMLLAELAPDDPLTVEIGEIRAAAARAALLTRHLLALSRRQISEPRRIDLNAVIREHCRELGHLLGEGIEIVTDLTPELGAIEADPGQMHQLLMNLSVNARDAMPRGGKLIFHTANTDIAGGPEAASAAAGEPGSEAPAGRYVLLSVSDTGEGMDRETLARIFEPFFSTKPAGSGAGLGLSTVYGVVKQAGGFIRAISEPGSGSTFRIYLPRAADPLSQSEPAGRTALPESVAQTASPGPAEAGPPETVLLVERDPEVRRLTMGILRRLGYEVLEAGDGPAALDAARRHPGPIHLLVCNTVISGAPAREFAARIQALRPRLKVLYLSGRGTDAADDSAPCLEKPFTSSDLATRVREVLDQPGCRPRVLVVDDDSGVREFLGRVLTRAGYDVLFAADGEEGLARIEREAVHLVITDLVMPQRDGLEVVKLLRSRFGGVRIIAISGAFGGEFLKAASILGADFAFPKPVDPERLLPAVQKLIG